ncbi:MAG: TIGR03364 family FAD-dependent oxidoreductase [Phenylobacterium sp.]|uniref:TIGR03364 family FAD-dependent oxidoreductase n=1 Tax=Phenylobacterium sp. TaxID=1871053 RepID=UPI0017FD56C2|nr:TIGR03364 family FAD-dependent oxidoreductase [Phenylobacterium sp.]MBA4794848.1 TIGR03364 family FAD-dependent oxidoreductase [Phenylobacterium sp.]
MKARYDLAVVGAGIVGLACALAAARRGRSVVVIDRDAQANGASVRNFGFVTVTGQPRGGIWARARRSREVWDEIAGEAGIEVLQRGLWLPVRRPEAVAVLEAFLRTEMGEECRLLSPQAARARAPEATGPETAAVLWSPHERRVDSRTAIPRLAAWLTARFGVDVLRQTAVHEVAPPRIATARGAIEAEAAVVCPGDDLVSLYPGLLADAGLVRCKLQMMRLAPPGFALPSPVMSDLGLVRYGGYAALPEAAALRERLQAEQGEALAHGVHLIAVQDGDGALVVGDSHHDAPTPDPFASEAVDRLILDEWRAATGRDAPPVLQRWTGTYARGPQDSLIAAPHERVRLALVTAGNGASTAFAFGEEVIADLFEETP